MISLILKTTYLQSIQATEPTSWADYFWMYLWGWWWAWSGCRGDRGMTLTGRRGLLAALPSSQPRDMHSPLHTHLLYSLLESPKMRCIVKKAQCAAVGCSGSVEGWFFPRPWMLHSPALLLSSTLPCMLPCFPIISKIEVMKIMMIMAIISLPPVHQLLASLFDQNCHHTTGENIF